jgi:hypothetical protein
VNQSNSCELAGSIELLLGVVPRVLGNSCANSESRSAPDNVRPEVGGWPRRAKAARNATYDTDWEVVSFGNSPPRAWQEQPNLYRINSSGLSIRERRERQYLLPCWAVTASRPVCIARCAGPRVGVMCWLNPGFPPSRRHGRGGGVQPRAGQPPDGSSITETHVERQTGMFGTCVLRSCGGEFGVRPGLLCPPSGKLPSWKVRG